jgi:hypothetical protein
LKLGRAIWTSGAIEELTLGDCGGLFGHAYVVVDENMGHDGFQFGGGEEAPRAGEDDN